jgi:hypothetical protein
MSWSYIPRRRVKPHTWLQVPRVPIVCRVTPIRVRNHTTAFSARPRRIERVARVVG